MFKWKDIIICVLLILCICCSVTAALKTGFYPVVGPQGAKGEQGVQGEKGDRGEQGLIGPTGPQGEKGIDGLNGIDGNDGNDGIDGKDGLIPYINKDGMWCIGDTVTEWPAVTVYDTSVIWGTLEVGDVIKFRLDYSAVNPELYMLVGYYTYFDSLTSARNSCAVRVKLSRTDYLSMSGTNLLVKGTVSAITRDTNNRLTVTITADTLIK
jgi:hypothetical protein